MQRGFAFARVEAGVPAVAAARIVRLDAAEPFLAGLTPAQREAASILSGPALCVAGPGSGKTRTLTARIGALIASGVARPDEIAAVTFTRKAAAELGVRLRALLGADAGSITIGTFHRLAAGLQPLPAGARVLDDAERHELALAAVRSAGRAETERAGSGAGKGTEKTAERRAVRLVQAVSLLKAAGSGWLAALDSRETPGWLGVAVPADLAERDALRAEIVAYEALRAAHGALDLDDLLLGAVAALRAGAALRTFRFLSVDEYQDVSGVQRELVRALYDAAVPAGGPEPERRSVFAIGDPDQAIYAFRGAAVAHFHAFADDFPGARTVRLRENFRSAGTIVEASAAVIAVAPDRPADTAPRAARAAGGPIVHVPAPGPRAEAVFIVREIERLLGGTSLLSHDQRRAPGWAAGAYALSDFAVLTRTASRADQLAEALMREGLPLLRPRRAHLTSEAARELLAYLSFAARPQDPLALGRVIAREQRLHAATAGGGPLPRLLPGAPVVLAELGPLGAVLQARQAELAALGLRARLERVAALLSAPAAAVEAVTAHLARTGRGAGEEVPGEGGENGAPGDWDEADEWDERLERVAVLTLHGSKGLEFPVVFVSGCEAALLPGTPRAGTDAAQHQAEERRLFYVGMTRARDFLYLTRLEGPAPSPFLADVPPRLVTQPVQKRRERPPQLRLF